MNFLTHKLAPFVLLASSLVTSAYCMEWSQKLKLRHELSSATIEQINTFATHLQSSISQNLELPNILLCGTLDDKNWVAEDLAERFGLTCPCVLVDNLCKCNQDKAAKYLEELFKRAQTGPEKIMIILYGAEAFKLSSSITNQFLALTGTPSSNYMLAFTIDNFALLPKALVSRVGTKIYINTESEANLDDTVEPKGECSLQ